MQCSTVQCSAVQYNAVQCGTVQCGTEQCSAVQCSAVHTVLYSELLLVNEQHSMQCYVMLQLIMEIECQVVERLKLTTLLAKTAVYL